MRRRPQIAQKSAVPGFSRVSKIWNECDHIRTAGGTIFLFFARYCPRRENNFIRSGRLCTEHGPCRQQQARRRRPVSHSAGHRRDSWAVAAAVAVHRPRRRGHLPARSLVTRDAVRSQRRGNAPLSSASGTVMSAAPIPKTAPFADDEIEVLNRVVGPATPVQRAWLAGFLAGLDAASGEAVAQPAAARAAGRAADDPVRDRVRQFRKARGRCCEIRAQDRAEADARRHGGSRYRDRLPA